MSSSLVAAAAGIEKLGTFDKRQACVAAATTYFSDLRGLNAGVAATAHPSLGVSVPEPEVATSSAGVLATLTVLQALLSSVVSVKSLGADDVATIRLLLLESCRRWAVRIPRSVMASASIYDGAVAEALAQVGRFQRCCYGLVWGAAERASTPTDALQLRVVALSWCCETAVCSLAAATAPLAVSTTSGPKRAPSGGANAVADSFEQPASLLRLVLPACQFAVKQYVLASSAPAAAARTTGAADTSARAQSATAPAAAALAAIVPLFEKALACFAFPVAGSVASTSAAAPAMPPASSLGAVWLQPSVRGVFGEWLRWLATLAASASAHDTAGDVYGCAVLWIGLLLNPTSPVSLLLEEQAVLRLQLAEAQLSGACALLRYRRSALRSLDETDGVWQLALVHCAAASPSLGASGLAETSRDASGSALLQSIFTSTVSSSAMSSGCLRHVAASWRHVVDAASTLRALPIGVTLSSCSPASATQFAAVSGRIADRVLDLQRLFLEHVPILACTPLHRPAIVDAAGALQPPRSSQKATWVSRPAALAAATPGGALRASVSIARVAPGSIAATARRPTTALAAAAQHEFPAMRTAMRPSAGGLDAPVTAARPPRGAAGRRALRWAEEGEGEEEEAPVARAGGPSAVPFTAVRRPLQSRSGPGAATPSSAWAAATPATGMRRVLRMSAVGELDDGCDDDGGDAAEDEGGDADPASSLALRFADLGVDDAAPAAQSGEPAPSFCEAEDGEDASPDGDCVEESGTPGLTPTRRRRAASPPHGDASDVSDDIGGELIDVATAPIPRSWWELLELLASSSARAVASLVGVPVDDHTTPPNSLARPCIVLWVAAARIRVIALHMRPLTTRADELAAASSSLSSLSLDDASSLASHAALALARLHRMAVLSAVPPAHSGGGAAGRKSQRGDSGSAVSDAPPPTPINDEESLLDFSAATTYIEHALDMAIAAARRAGCVASPNIAAPEEPQLRADVSDALGLVYNCAVTHVNALAAHASAAAAAAAAPASTSLGPAVARRPPSPLRGGTSGSDALGPQASSAVAVAAAAAAAAVPRGLLGKAAGGRSARVEESPAPLIRRPSESDPGASAALLPSAEQLGCCNAAALLLGSVSAGWERWVAAAADTAQGTSASSQQSVSAGASAALRAAFTAAKLPTRLAHLCAVLRHRVGELSALAAQPATAGPVVVAELTVSTQALSAALARLAQWSLVEALVGPLGSGALGAAAEQLRVLPQLGVSTAEGAALAPPLHAAVIAVSGLSHGGAGSPIASLTADVGAAAATLASALRRGGLAEVVACRAVVNSGAAAAAAAATAASLFAPQQQEQQLQRPPADWLAARSRRRVLGAALAGAAADAASLAATMLPSEEGVPAALVLLSACIAQNAFATAGIRTLAAAASGGSSPPAPAMDRASLASAASQWAHGAAELRQASCGGERQEGQGSNQGPTSTLASLIPFAAGRDALLSLPLALAGELASTRVDEVGTPAASAAGDAPPRPGGDSGSGTPSRDASPRADDDGSDAGDASDSDDSMVGPGDGLRMGDAVGAPTPPPGSPGSGEGAAGPVRRRPSGGASSRSTGDASSGPSSPPFSCCEMCSHIADLVGVGVADAASPAPSVCAPLLLLAAAAGVELSLAARSRGCRCPGSSPGQFVARAAATPLSQLQRDRLPVPSATLLGGRLLSLASVAVAVGLAPLRAAILERAYAVLSVSLEGCLQGQPAEVLRAHHVLPAQLTAASAVMDACAPAPPPGALPERRTAPAGRSSQCQWSAVLRVVTHDSEAPQDSEAPPAAPDAAEDASTRRARVGLAAQRLAGAMRGEGGGVAPAVARRRTVAAAASQHALAATAHSAVAAASSRAYGAATAASPRRRGTAAPQQEGEGEQGGRCGSNSLGIIAPLLEAVHVHAALAARSWAKAALHLGGGGGGGERARGAFALAIGSAGSGAPFPSSSGGGLGAHGLSLGGYEDLIPTGVRPPSSSASASAASVPPPPVPSRSRQAGSSSGVTAAAAAAASREVAAAGAAAAAAAVSGAPPAASDAAAAPPDTHLVPGGVWGATVAAVVSLGEAARAWMARGDAARALYCLSKALHTCEAAGLGGGLGGGGSGDLPPLLLSAGAAAEAPLYSALLAQRAAAHAVRGAWEAAAADCRRLLAGVDLTTNGPADPAASTGAAAAVVAAVASAVDAPDADAAPRGKAARAKGRGAAKAAVKRGAPETRPPPPAAAQSVGEEDGQTPPRPAADVFALSAVALVLAEVLTQRRDALLAPLQVSPGEAEAPPSAPLETLLSPAFAEQIARALQRHVEPLLGAGTARHHAPPVGPESLRVACYALARLQCATGRAADAAAVVERALLCFAADRPPELASEAVTWAQPSLAPRGALCYAGACAVASVAASSPAAGTGDWPRARAMAARAVDGMAAAPLAWGSPHALRRALRLLAVATLQSAGGGGSEALLAAQCTLQSVGWAARLGALHVARRRLKEGARAVAEAVGASRTGPASPAPCEAAAVALEGLASELRDGDLADPLGLEAAWCAAMDPLAALQQGVLSLSRDLGETSHPALRGAMKGGCQPTAAVVLEPVTRTLLVVRVGSHGAGSATCAPFVVVAAVPLSDAAGGAADGASAHPDRLHTALAEMSAVLSSSADTLALATHALATATPAAAPPPPPPSGVAAAAPAGTPGGPPAAITLSKAQKAEWWAARHALDARLRSLCAFLQGPLLGPAAALLAPVSYPSAASPVAALLEAARDRSGGEGAAQACAALLGVALASSPSSSSSSSSSADKNGRPPGRRTEALRGIAAAAQAANVWKKGRSALNAVAEVDVPAPTEDAPLSQSDPSAAAASSSAPAAAKGKRRGGVSGSKQAPLLPRKLQAGPQPDRAPSEAAAAAVAFDDDLVDEEDDDEEGAAPVEVSRAGAGEGGEDAARLHPDDLPRLRVPQLRAALAAAGLPDAGLKAELVARLRGHLLLLASLAGDGRGDAASGRSPLEGTAPLGAPDAASAPASPEQMRAPPDPSRPGAAPDAATAAAAPVRLAPTAVAPQDIIRSALEAAGAASVPAYDRGRIRALCWQGEAVATGHPASKVPAAAAAQQQQHGGGEGPAPLLLLLCETLSLGLPWEGMPLLRADAACPPASVCRIPALAWAYLLPPQLLTAPPAATAADGTPASLLRGGLEALRLYTTAGVPSARRAPPPSASLRRPPPPSPSFRRRFSYVINPGGDLGRTQRVLEPLMRGLGEAAGRAWGAAAPPPPLVAGLAGRAAAQGASVSSLLALQASGDAHIYCGHGGGEALCGGRDTLATAAPRLPPTLLMGCSSGRLCVRGAGEAEGLPLAYLQAGCPAAAACLWDVTDRDLDRFTAALVTTWLLPDYADAAVAAAAAALPSSAGAASSDAGGPLLLDLSLAAALSRGVCKLPALVGLAPVCYGLPVHATP